MKKQSGFTLIELMVVMAIIAILATAGLAAYMGYIKKTRDTARIADIITINKAILTVVTQSGQSPISIAEVNNAIKEVNNKVSLKDPVSWDSNCLPSLNAVTVATEPGPLECDYYYTQCDAGAGFAIGVRFESPSNQSKYANDNIGAIPAWSFNLVGSDKDSLYSLGSCAAYCGATDCTAAVQKYEPIV